MEATIYTIQPISVLLLMTQSFNKDLANTKHWMKITWKSLLNVVALFTADWIWNRSSLLRFFQIQSRHLLKRTWFYITDLLNYHQILSIPHSKVTHILMIFKQQLLQVILSKLNWDRTKIFNYANTRDSCPANNEFLHCHSPAESPFCWLTRMGRINLAN